MSNPSTRIFALCALVFATNVVAAGSISTTQATASNGASLLVNGEPIKQSSIDLLKDKQRITGVLDDAELEQKVQDELVMETIFTQQALKNKLDADPRIAAELAVTRLAILSKAYLNEHFKAHPVTEEMIRTQYERQRTAGKIKEYRVRHLSVATEAAARDILKQINSGQDFAALAKSKSTDPGANVNGGDIGWFRPDIFVDANFADAVTRLKKGEMTQSPVKTRWGWQIIKVEDGPRPVKDAPPFDKVSKDVKDALMQKTMKKELDKFIESNRAASTITRSVALDQN